MKKDNLDIINNKSISIKNSLIKVMQLMEKLAYESSNYTKPNNLFRNALTALLEPEFNLVICGEVKRGKSTFINALIGKELLPTGVKETTSQVFRVTYSDNESYSLVFTDGSVKSISFDDLKRYGSQTDADIHGENLFDGKHLAYIQVNTPIAFLPKGVTIVDTPGLGALYKSHEEITNNYISRADAVVFVLDATKPLVQQEKEFLSKYVFSKTPYVMFVMTKVDTVSEDSWVQLLRRNETLLKDAFAEQCYNTPKVFPISSVMLFNAALEEDAEEKKWMLEDSLFPEAKEELISLVARALAFSRNTNAFERTKEYYKQTIMTIEEQLKMLTVKTTEEQQKLKDSKNELIKLFEEDWGRGSTKRNEIIQKVNLILNGVKTNSSQLFSSSSNIYKKYEEKIDSFEDKEKLKQFSETLSKDIVGDLSKEWQAITSEAEKQIAIELAKMRASIEKLKINHFNNQKSDYKTSISEISNEEYFMGFRGSFMNASIATTAVGTALWYLVGISLGPIAWAVAIGTILYGVFSGTQDAEKKIIDKNKKELKKILNEIFDSARKTMLNVEIMEGKYLSNVDAFVQELSKAAENALDSLYKESKKQLDEESRQLDKQLKLNSEEKQAEFKQLNSQKQEWIKIGEKISEQDKELISLQEIIGSVNQNTEMAI